MSSLWNFIYPHESSRPFPPRSPPEVQTFYLFLPPPSIFLLLGSRLYLQTSSFQSTEPSRPQPSRLLLCLLATVLLLQIFSLQFASLAPPYPESRPSDPLIFATLKQFSPHFNDNRQNPTNYKFWWRNGVLWRLSGYLLLLSRLDSGWDMPHYMTTWPCNTGQLKWNPPIQ